MPAPRRAFVALPFRAARDQRPDGEGPRRVDLRQAPGVEPHRRRAPRGAPRAHFYLETTENQRQRESTTEFTEITDNKFFSAISVASVVRSLCYLVTSAA